MSWLSSAVKGAGKALGKVAGVAAPIVSLIPGAGAVPAALLKGASSVLGGHNLKNTLTETAKGAAMGAIGGPIGGILGKIPGVSSIAGKVGGLLSHIPGASVVSGGGRDGSGNFGMVGDALGALTGRKAPAVGTPEWWAQQQAQGGQGGAGGVQPGSLQSLLGGGGVGGTLGSIGGFLGNNKDALLGTASAAYGIKRAGDADKLRQQALGSATGAYNERAPLRLAGVSRMLNPARPNLSALVEDPSNPFYRPRRVA